MRITPTEHETQNAIMELLAVEGIFAFRLNSAAAKVDRRFFRAHSLGRGAADIFALPCPKGQYTWDEMAELWSCRRCYQAWLRNAIPRCQCHRFPRPTWIEVKSGTGKQSPDQASFQKHVESKGHKYILARSVEDVRNALQD